MKLLFFFVSALIFATVVRAEEPTVLLISIDGFAAGYWDKYPSPTLHAWAKEGIHASHLTPVFPTSTFPNHFTLVTGVYPEKHGIVANEMVDPKLGSFQPGKPNTVARSGWWEAEPIWVTAEKQGIKTAPLYWVGSTAEIKGVRPTYWKNYDPKFSKMQRIEQMLKWIDLPEGKRPRLLTLYFEEVDRAGHAHGPNSPEVKEAVLSVDAALAKLAAELEKRSDHLKLDIIVVSDHGMAEVPTDHYVAIDKIINVSNVPVMGSGAFLSIRPPPAKFLETLKALTEKQTHFHCYAQDSFPHALHYQFNSRIAPITCLADEGWYLQAKAPLIAPKTIQGAHGYDTALDSMQAIFLAKGPHFAKGREMGQVNNTDIYLLIAKILNLKPERTEGNEKAVKDLLAAQ